MDLKKIYTDIYKLNYWSSKESVSGGGSEVANTVKIRQLLPKLFDLYNVKHFVDAPCGDFNWMQLVDMSGLFSYVGIDIVKEIIVKNQKYFNEKISFQVGDLTKDRLPDCDMIFIKDCFIHFSFEDIFKVLNNIKRSDIKYLAVNQSTDLRTNDDIETGGGYRFVNLFNEPFNLSGEDVFSTDFSDLVVYEVKNI